jgi:stress-induced morphogen
MTVLLEMSFPKSEWNDIQLRLSQSKSVYTIRVSNECGKYHEGDILHTEWRAAIRIVSIKNISKGLSELQREYQYFDQLTDDMKKELMPFQKMEIISFEAICS